MKLLIWTSLARDQQHNATVASKTVKASANDKKIEDLSKSIESGDADKAKEIITALKAEVDIKDIRKLYKMKTGKNLKEDIGKNISSGSWKYTKIAGIGAAAAASRIWIIPWQYFWSSGSCNRSWCRLLNRRRYPMVR